MKEYVITKNGWNDDCIIAFENKKQSYVRLFMSRLTAERHGKRLERWFGYTEVFPWEVFCKNSEYTGGRE